MFRPLGLLNDVACPDHQEGLCASRRTECPFSHTIVVKAKRARPEDDQPTTATSSKPSTLTSQLLPKRQRVNAYQQPADRASSSSSSAMPPRDRAADDGNDDGEGWTTVSHKRPNKTASATTTSSSSSSSTSAPPNSSIIRHVPTISPRQHTNNSGILLSSRNVCLKTLYDHFTMAYAPLLDPSERTWVQNAGFLLASQDALQQERDVWQRASKMSYRSSIVTMAVGIKKRDIEAVKRALREAIASLPDNSDDEDQDAKARSLATKMRGLCTEVGTNAAVDEKRRSEERRIKTELSVEKLKEAGLICPVDRLAELGFDVVATPSTPNGEGSSSSSSSSSSKGKQRARDADADPDEAWGKGSSEPTAIGQKKECERCRREFIVGGEDGKGQDENACHYHWGKKIFERDPTAGVRHRVQVWTCCGKGVESSGLSLSQIASFGGGPTTTVAGDRTCSVGPHVFKEEDVAQLHRREGFVSTERLAREVGLKDGDEEEYLDIVALDCELGYTTGGLSLTRVTLISEAGKIVYDSLCKPRAVLVDANVQFSGVTKSQISQPGIPSLPEVRQAIARYISPNTVLVGHGLENDLRALRLLHPLLVDTAILFPHPVKGFPFRQKLKDLAYRLLGRTIQAGMSTEGHSSVEDAKASLDLVKWKLEKEPGRTPWGGEGKEAVGLGKEGTGVAGGVTAGTTAQPANRSKTVVVSTGVRTLSAGNGAASRPVRPPPPQQQQQQQQRGTQDNASATPRRGSNGSASAGSGANGPSLFIPRRK